jgi:hypothetical protein
MAEALTVPVLSNFYVDECNVWQRIRVPSVHDRMNYQL